MKRPFPVAKKRFGQNFLIDQQVIRQLVEIIAPQPEDLIYEIGPGQAALTRPVLERAGTLTAIELDRDLAAELAADPSLSSLRVIQQDALRFDFAGDCGGRTFRVIGNLPYNMATPLIFRMLSLPCSVRDLHFMVQKEVGERLCAAPGSKAYGRMSVMAQFQAEISMLALVPPGAFRPIPKVTSCFVRLLPRTLSPDERKLAAALDVVTRTAFGYRRKQIVNSLGHLFSEQALESLKISPGLRPENLSIADFVRLASELQAR